MLDSSVIDIEPACYVQCGVLQSAVCKAASKGEAAKGSTPQVTVARCSPPGARGVSMSMCRVFVRLVVFMCVHSTD